MTTTNDNATPSRFLIVDDEALARDRLVRLLGDIEPAAIIAQVDNGRAAIELCTREHIDVVLLDIRMPGMDGLQIANHLSRMPQPPAIIFTTAYDHYAIEAFEAEAVGYLLKPVRAPRLASALTRAQKINAERLGALVSASGVSNQRQQICVQSSGGLELVPIADVLYFLVEQKLVRMVHKNGSNLVDESLRALEEEFAGDFLRVHRNALVATHHARAIQTDDEGHAQLLFFDHSGTAPVSRRMESGVKKALRELGRHA